MPIPILTPRAQQPLLPTDVMARIAQGIGQTRFAQPLMEAQLRQRQAQTKLTQEKVTQAGIPTSTPAQNAIDLYLNSFKQDPNSAQTKLLGLAVKKAVQGSKGTSITTADGTQINFGGTADATPIFGNAGGGTPTSTQPETPDQTAINAIFPPQPPTTETQLPFTSGSRKIAGSTTVNTETGAVTSRPTRTVTTLNQNAVESVQKLKPLLEAAVNGFAPFAGISGKTHGLIEGIKIGFGGGTIEQQNQIQQLQAARDKAVIGATDLMRALGAPNVVQLENEFRKVIEPRAFENPRIYRARVLDDLMSTVNEFASKAQVAQIHGILVGTLGPKDLQITPTLAKVKQVTRTKDASAQQSTAELIRIAQGGQ